MTELLTLLTNTDDCDHAPNTVAVRSIREACEQLADSGYDVESNGTDERALVSVNGHWRVRLVRDRR